MGVDIRLPNINAASESGQLAQIKSYLYQFAEQMKWAMDTIDSGNSTSIINANTGKPLGSSGGATANKQNEMSNFDSIKALIIKSADIVDAYYEEINRRLSGKYVAESTFGTYKEETNKTIQETSDKTQQSFEKIEKIEYDIEVINEKVTDAYIKEGHLEDRIITENISLSYSGGGSVDEAMPEDGVYEVVEMTNLSEDIYSYTFSPHFGGMWINTGENKLTVGSKVNLTFEEYERDYGSQWNIKSSTLETSIPIYGLEIRQTNLVDGVEVFDKLAQFTSDRLSFFDKNDTEIAYISDYKLFITNAEITGTLKLGAYIIDTTNGLAFKWVGRS